MCILIEKGWRGCDTDAQTHRRERRPDDRTYARTDKRHDGHSSRSIPMYVCIHRETLGFILKILLLGEETHVRKRERADERTEAQRKHRKEVHGSRSLSMCMLHTRTIDFIVQTFSDGNIEFVFVTHNPMKTYIVHKICVFCFLKNFFLKILNTSQQY